MSPCMCDGRDVSLGTCVRGGFTSVCVNSICVSHLGRDVCSRTLPFLLPPPALCLQSLGAGKLKEEGGGAAGLGRASVSQDPSTP